MHRLLLCLFSLCLGIALDAQTMSISGTVLSTKDNSPVAGAFVVVSGTRVGTSTDQNGKFSLNNVPSKSTTVDVTCLGMKDAVANIQKQMVIYLDENSESLDEVMVVAYGTTKKNTYTGSASVVKSESIRNLPNASFENALSGKVAGLQVTASSGQAGSVNSIRIRGIGSMNASNEPLYVVDGVPVFSGDAGSMSGMLYATNSMLNNLNPDDIESISVLKDAAASSLYGSRAANGVILITTKKGRQGKPVVSFGASVGVTPAWATDNYEPADTQAQVNMLYTVFHRYDTVEKKMSDDAASADAIKRLNTKFNKHGYSFKADGTDAYANVAISDYDNSGRAGTYYNWDDAYFRTSVYQSYNFSVSGANDNTNYYTSLSYADSQGRMKVNGFNRTSARLNLNQKVGKFFEIGTNVSMSKTNRSGFNDTRSTAVNYFMQSRNLLWGLYWPTDYKTGDPWTARYGSYVQNNVYYDNEWSNNAGTLDSSIAETFVLHLTPELNLKSILSYDNSTVKEKVYFSANHFLGSATNGQINEMRTIYTKTVTSTTANYTHNFDEHNNFAALVGFETEKNNTDFSRATGENLPTSTLHTVSTAGTFKASGYSWGNSMMSVLSKLDYNYAYRYFLSASFRRDGSSRLSPDTRWGNFWSVSGSWKIKDESFMKNVNYLSDLRLRASYGVNGTLPTDNYGYINLMSYDNAYMGNPGGSITTIANNDLTWETSNNTNIGLDFGFFDNRFRGTVEYYNRDSRNLLQDVPISRVTGFTTTLQNVGEINNKGLELQLDGDIIRKKDLIWSASANISFLKSKVTKLYDGADIIWYDPTGGDDRAQYIYREGESTLAFYGYEWAGVDKTNGKSVYYVNDPSDSQKGDFSYNGRGATYDFNNANYKIIGNAVPFANGGFSTSVNYKGIDFGMNFIYKLGGKLYDGAYKDVADDGYYWERIRAKSYYENMWTPTNTDGTQPALSGSDLEDAMQYSTRQMHDATFLRLKTLTLGYTLPKIWSRKAFISKARLYCNISNLLTFSKYKEADPEVNAYGTRGWETPIGKTYLFGIDLQF